jgi:hypothetical protein
MHITEERFPGQAAAERPEPNQAPAERAETAEERTFLCPACSGSRTTGPYRRRVTCAECQGAGVIVPPVAHLTAAPFTLAPTDDAFLSAARRVWRALSAESHPDCAPTEAEVQAALWAVYGDRVDELLIDADPLQLVAVSLRLNTKGGSR